MSDEDGGYLLDHARLIHPLCLGHRNLATLEEACLKKGDNFSEDLHPILLSEVRYCRILKNGSLEVNYPV
jgi:hypothetical protein